MFLPLTRRASYQRDHSGVPILEGRIEIWNPVKSSKLWVKKRGLVITTVMFLVCVSAASSTQNILLVVYRLSNISVEILQLSSKIPMQNHRRFLTWSKFMESTFHSGTCPAI
jgi:hypothetical protein